LSGVWLRMVDEAGLSEKYRVLAGMLDERSRRLWAAAEARAGGRGGFAAVLRATGLSSRTLARGLRELEFGETAPLGRIRRPGGGGEADAALDRGLMSALGAVVQRATKGEPQPPLRWTCKGTRRLAQELRARGYRASHSLVSQLLQDAGYQLQANGK